jgi:hypothetical protein
MKTICTLTLAGAITLLAAAPPESKGKRPYELDWANRAQDHCPPLVDFEELSGWRVDCHDAEAKFERSGEEPIWGPYAGKLTYRGGGSSPDIRVLPPAPIVIGQPFDAISLWCYGNNWGWTTDPTTPRVNLSALFDDAEGKEFSVFLYTVDWKEWSLLHRRLSPEQIQRVKKGAKFKGLHVTGGKNKEDRVLYFDNLAVFTESFAPLAFEPRPLRGVEMLPGQSAGANTGPSRLPFPTQDRTILPSNITGQFTNSIHVQSNGTAFNFTYEGVDGRLVYALTPRTGAWSDIFCEWQSPPPSEKPRPDGAVAQFQPCVDGGVYLQTADGPALPDKAEHLGSNLQGDTVESRWRLSARDVSAEVTYVYRLWNKSLVIDVLAPGGQVAEVRFGRASGLVNPRLVTNPFYPAENGRPAVVVSGAAAAPLFLTGNADWYLSNGSILWAANAASTQGIAYNGGTRYIPLTNGRRNDCFERFFVTISPKYEEVLPNIPNPPSPWKPITGTRLWRAHGASDREQDRNYWSEVHRYGMTQMIVTDHETMWRDEGESFTFRTKAAPGKGGDKGAYDYARFMQDKLGFVYGPYNNYTDFAPVNEFWNFDRVSRDAQNQLQHAWMRCYAPKPARAVEFCARLAPVMQEKFKFSTAYCDVHTAVAPWHRVDYDPRAPGAGTFAAVFYSYGEIMLHQKNAWQGPVYSEGNFHCFYMGLTDGNYGQDQSYRPAENPWLVDFDLRKMHDLGCNFGMGNLEMFYANAPQPRATTEERDAEIDRFLAATVAFGHPGFLVMEGGMGNALRSYYMLQQLHSRYCLTNAAEIRYVSADGRLLDTSHAIAGGDFRRSQVITRYADGTVTAANGSRTERLRCEVDGRTLDLPPNGYAGWTAVGPSTAARPQGLEQPGFSSPSAFGSAATEKRVTALADGAIEVLSSDSRGHRSDYAFTPAYIYVDGRGKFARFDQAAGNGIGVCRILPKGQHEIILLRDAECGFSVKASTAVALDKDNKELGAALLRTARGLTYVVTVKGAFSYRLDADAEKPGSSIPAANAQDKPSLSCERDEVVPGERIVIQGRQAHEYQVPIGAKPGERLWLEYEGAWIDFTVVPLALLREDIDANALHVGIVSRLQRAEPFTLEAGACTQQFRLEPGQAFVATLDLGMADRESAEVLPMVLRSGPMSVRKELGLRTAFETLPLGTLSDKISTGMALRGRQETPDFGASGASVRWELIACGETSKFGMFMHPPWQAGTGYSFATSERVPLPENPPAAFRASVGKASGSDPGDGILFKISVIDDTGRETEVAQTTVQKHEWNPIEADLSRWAGKTIRLKSVTDAGPKDDSSGDWAGWGDMRIESLRPLLHRRLEPDIERIRHEQGPFPIASLTPAQLNSAKSGKLHYEGKGMEGPGLYGKVAVLNGIELGDMPSAAGDESAGSFSKDVEMPLPPAAVRSLLLRNEFALKNPNHDCFSVRRIWIELELEDGRKCSSDIATPTFSQPPGWKYAEGIPVPETHDIAVDLWFNGSRVDRMLR